VVHALISGLVLSQAPIEYPQGVPCAVIRVRALAILRLPVVVGGECERAAVQSATPALPGSNARLARPRLARPHHQSSSMWLRASSRVPIMVDVHTT
jgi:hypothetical protein